MSNISNEMLNETKTELKMIIDNLEDSYKEITNDLEKIQTSLKTLKSWNLQDASEVYEEKNLYNIFSSTIRYKYIWSIQLQNDGLIVDSLLNGYFQTIEENIKTLALNERDLEQLSNTLGQFIHEIELQLGVYYTGNINDFFQKLKNNPTWQEMKEKAKNATYQKQKDELYNIFHSDGTTKDVVDIALDEMGMSYLTTTLSSKYALWYLENYPGSGATPSDDWCAEFVSYIMNKSGNDKALPPYLNVIKGAQEARYRASTGEGVWHSSHDASYEPQRGDVFYTYEGKHQHTGIVLGSEENYIYTIEGNTAADDGSYYVSTNSNKGGCVNTRIREKSYVEGGYYTPNYNENKIQPQDEKVTISNDTYNIKNGIDEKYQELRVQMQKEQRAGMG